jgi:hypothetical protein
MNEMNGMVFKKAERKKAKLKLAIAGPSGSGKTMSALRLAQGIGGKIAVIDTENGSASLYADRFEFDTLPLYPPYTTEKYLAAMDAAVRAGYELVIIDSISHQWAGEGGVLNRKEQMDARGGNSYTNWGKLTPEQEKFKSAILHYPAHLIVTMRSKQDYILVENDKGKQAPRKVGMAPVQREGMEYEFTTVFDVAMNHEAAVSKDRTSIFNDQHFMVTEKTGEALKAWLNSGADVTPVQQAPAAPVAPQKPVAPIQPKPQAEQPKAPQFDPEAPTAPAPVIAPASPRRKELKTQIVFEQQRLKWGSEQLNKFIAENTDGKTSTQMTDAEMETLLTYMQRQPAAAVIQPKQ